MTSNRDFFKTNLLKNDLVAAPMAGITHMPFRLILRKFFDGLLYSEMMSVEGISRKNPDSCEFLDRAPEETPLVFQLFGGKAQSFAEAIEIAVGYSKVDAFDINMGCPVKKVLKSGGGCSFLSDLPRMKEVIKAARRATDLPLSIKTRVGLDNSKLVYNEVLNIVEGEGADALIIHARTKSDMFAGTVRLDILEEVAGRAKIPIIGNGGVVDFASYKAMKETGVAGVMVGRAMMKAPWVFEAIRLGKNPEEYLAADKIGAMLHELWGFMKKHAGDDEKKQIHYKHILRKEAVWFAKGMRDAVAFRVKIYQTEDVEEVLRLVDEYFISAQV